MFSKKFLLDLIERAVRSFAGGYATYGVFGDAAVFSYKALEFGLGAAAASIILALASTPFGDKDSASAL